MPSDWLDTPTERERRANIDGLWAGMLLGLCAGVICGWVARMLVVP